MTKKVKQKIKIGISIGDLNGIGAEIIIKSLIDQRICEICTPVIFASKKWCDYFIKSLNLNDFNFNLTEDLEKLKSNQVNVLAVWTKDAEVKEGEESEISGSFAYKSLEAACTALKEKKIDALVTAPINKKAIQSADFNFPGHTEYLQNIDGADDSLMLMLSEHTKIGVVSGHIPIKEVAAQLNSELILKKISLLNKSLKEDFNIRKPSIAVLGLNPHAGDNGLLGNEEKDIILPAIQQAKSIDVLAFGPYAADGFFSGSNFKNFDGVLAMYHDQGLIPAKMFSLGEGVNYTAGLSFVRTSPDHGTAFEIAGKGVANETSFRNAIYSAIDIVKNRQELSELQEDMLVPNKTRN
ncbi:MAG: 4-hydroxythreonine-4-phosphate dehydrogenase PdxA [Vicingaceae bacterium]